MDVVYSVFSFVVAIGVLVTIHEFGHFWVARQLGVKVLRFSVGFGPPLKLWRSGPDQTEYVLAAVPLGGYVKMLDEREGEVDSAELPRAFNRKPLAVRFAIVFAGPLFNFLFAVFAYWATFVIGVTGLKPIVGEVTPGSIADHGGMHPGQEILAVDGRKTKTWESVVHTLMSEALDQDKVHFRVKDPQEGPVQIGLDLRGVHIDELTRGQFFDVLGFEPMRPQIPPELSQVEANGPADRAGLQAGDRIVAVNGEAIAGWRGFVEAVRNHPEQAMEVTLERDAQRIDVVLTPAAVSDNGATVGRIGAEVAPLPQASKYVVTEQYGVISALGSAVSKTYEISLFTLRMLWKMIQMEVSIENLSGPISIAQYAGSSAQIGIVEFLQFLAIVSVSLGILNLLPIPVLDGGHLMYYVIEFIKGRPVSESAQLVGQRVGLAVLFGLMVLAFYNDVARLFG